MMMKPLIGITGRRLPSSDVSTLEDRYRHTSVDMYFSDFSRWIARAGGLAVEIPYESASNDIIDRLDGLVITGGQDINPKLWGGRPQDAADGIDTARDDYEVILAKAAVRAELPLLGVCRGAQILNVALGGTLVPHLADENIDHTSTGHKVETLQHEVHFEAGSLAAGLYGVSTMVNSLHHQAVDRCAADLLVTGWAPDGTVESIELPGSPVLGVQWHPEWTGSLDPSFRWIVNCALDRAVGIDVR